MASSDPTNVKKTPSIGYVGEDIGHWEEIQKRYNKLYPKMGFDFHTFSKFNIEEYLKLIPEIIGKKLDILYLDFSKYTDDNNHLGKQLKRLNPTKEIEIVGLIEREQGKEQLIKMTLMGIKLFSIKDDEFHDCVYDAMSVKFPNQAHTPAFAYTDAQDYLIVNKYLRINNIGKESMQIETDAEWKKNELVTIETNIPEKCLKSRKMYVKSRSEKNHYYDFKFVYELDFEFVSPYRKKKKQGIIDDSGHFTPLNVIPDDLDPEEIVTREVKEPINEHDLKDLIQGTKRAMRAWVDDNLDRSDPKFTKVLIVEKDLNLYFHSKKSLGSYNFSCRLQPYIEKPVAELFHSFPSVIAFQLESPKEHTEDELEEKEEGKEVAKKESNEVEFERINDMEAFSKMIFAIRKIEAYEPIVILFNSDETSVNLQSQLAYKKIIAHSGDVSFDLITGVARKQTETIIIPEERRKRFFVKKNNPLSYGCIPYDIELAGLTESEVFFNTPRKFEMGSVLMINEPFKATLTVVNHTQKSSQGKLKDSTRALIGATSETEKMKIRQLLNYYVNKDKLDKENQETEEFLKKNADEAERRREAYEAKLRAEQEEAEQENDNEENKEFE